MPKFTFTCPDCKLSKDRLVNHTVITVDCECGSKMKRQLPQNVSSLSYERKDPHRGTQIRKNVTAKLRERHNKYHKYGTDDANKFGWFKKVKKV
jgi:hypothetical protein